MWRSLCAWWLSFSLVACESHSVPDIAQATKQKPMEPLMQELAGIVSDSIPQSSAVGCASEDMSGEGIINAVLVVQCIIVFGLLLKSRPSWQRAQSWFHKQGRDRHVSHQAGASSASRSTAQMEHRAFLSGKLNQHAIRGELQQMVRTLEEIEMRFPSIAEMTDYHRVIVHVARGGDPFTAHKWLRRSQEVGLRPTQATFTTVIRSYVKAGKYACARGVAKEMTSAGLEFDTVSYNAMIHAGLCEGDAADAQLWMKRMLASGVEPDAVSVATVMQACSSVDLLQELDYWFAFSHKLGFRLKPRTFDSILGDFQRRGDEVNAMKWLLNMIEHGLRPDINSFHRVLATIIGKGDVQLAGDLVQLMRVTCGKPSTCILNRCIVMAAREGQHVEAHNWAKECVAEGGALTQQARHALCQAGLRVPRIDNHNKNASAESKFESINGLDVGRTVHRDEANAQWIHVEAATCAPKAAARKEKYSSPSPTSSSQAARGSTIENF